MQFYTGWIGLMIVFRSLYLQEHSTTYTEQTIYIWTAQVNRIPVQGPSTV